MESQFVAYRCDTRGCTDGNDPMSLAISSYMAAIGPVVECSRYKSLGRPRYSTKFSLFSNRTYFGLAHPEALGCSDLLYVWGNLTHSENTTTIQHISDLGCNETFETLSVSTTFIGTTLDIDPRHPPQPLKHTVRSSFTTFRASSLYTFLAWTNTDPQYLAPFFAMLTSSPQALPISSLGDPASNPALITAIHYQHGIIQAQNLAQQLIPANATAATIPLTLPPSKMTDDVPRYHGTATTSAGSGSGSGRRCVLQDTTSTRVVQGLLATVLVLSLVSWVCMPGTDVLPRAPTTVASVVALWAGGNVFNMLPVGFEEGDGADGGMGLDSGPGLGLLQLMLAGGGGRMTVWRWRVRGESG